MFEKENKIVAEEAQKENTPKKSVDDLVYAMNEKEDNDEKNV